MFVVLGVEVDGAEGEGASSRFGLRASSKQNFPVFNLFRLYFPTVLHANIWISRGISSTSARSLSDYGSFLGVCLCGV